MRELAQQVILENVTHSPVVSNWAWQLNYYFRKFSAADPIQDLRDTDIATLVQQNEAFWIIFPEHLNQHQLDLINAKFELATDLLYHDSHASFYKKKQQGL